MIVVSCCALCSLCADSQVQGVATAAGCQLAAQADLCICSPEATFSTPGVQRGAFCTTPSVALSRSIPSPKHSLRMLLTGESLSAQQAHDRGLVSHIAPQGGLDEFTSGVAEQVARAATTTLVVGKRAFYRQREMGTGDAYGFAAGVMAGNFGMRDSKEGIAAFFEKRAPRWE